MSGQKHCMITVVRYVYLYLHLTYPASCIMMISLMGMSVCIIIQESTDLEIKAGQRILVTERSSADWFVLYHSSGPTRYAELLLIFIILGGPVWPMERVDCFRPHMSSSYNIGLYCLGHLMVYNRIVIYGIQVVLEAS